MKRKTKRILGSCGLLAVAAVTAIAALLPAPESSATSFSDQITVRVLSGEPEVDITNFTILKTVEPQINFDVDLVAVARAELRVDYTNKDGQTRGEVIGRWEPSVDYEERPFVVKFRELADKGLGEGEILALEENKNTKTAKESSIEEVASRRIMDVSRTTVAEEVTLAVVNGKTEVFRLAAGSDIPFGYGTYKFTLSGEGRDGKPAPSATKTVEYVPIMGKVNEGTGDGSGGEDDYYVLNLEYDETYVKKVVVKVTNKNTGDVKTYTLVNGEKSLTLEFKKSESGSYNVSWEAFGESNNSLTNEPGSEDVVVGDGGKPSENEPGDNEEPEVPNAGNVGKPDTGRFLGGLNISKVDYIVTGLIIFGIVVVAGVVFVLKGGKQKSKRK